MMATEIIRNLKKQRNILSVLLVISILACIVSNVLWIREKREYAELTISETDGYPLTLPKVRTKDEDL